MSTAHSTPCQTQQDWESLLSSEKTQPYFIQLLAQLKQQRLNGDIIYPPATHTFAAFKLTPLATVQVVILGQDPYHGPNQAHGLSFSVQDPTPPPPSLNNIFKALSYDYDCHFKPKSGDLSAWAKQGVLLLNSVLTVRAGQAQSHQHLGWQQFTDHVIHKIGQKTAPPCVFMLWGAAAQKKQALIDPEQHLILKSVHPSPLSAHRGFIQCRHFSQANTWLIQQKRSPIDWTCLK